MVVTKTSFDVQRPQLAVLDGGPVERNAPCPCGSGAKWKHCCAGERFKWSEGGRRKREKISAAWR